MTPGFADRHATGLLGPVAFCAGAALLLAAPLMRGGNRYVALIALEIMAVVILLALALRHSAASAIGSPTHHKIRIQPLLALLVLSPLLIAIVQLLPLPAGLWAQLPGRAIYAEALGNIGLPGTWRPLSVAPDATAASLLAGLPLAAALLLGLLASPTQLRLLLRCVVAMAMAQVVLGLLQISGGANSRFYFGAASDAAVGTFANRNHFANYLAMALCAYLWLAYEARHSRPSDAAARLPSGGRNLLWATGGLLLVLGILMSRSRGAAVFSLPCVLASVGLAALNGRHGARQWVIALGVASALVVAVAAFIGLDSVTARFASEQVVNAADFRAMLARTSFEGALAFWPWGSGWGTYDAAYPRFQPLAVAGFANHAHMDYVELLFEGGILFAALALAFLWLAVRRAIELFRGAMGNRSLKPDAMAAALCGLGLMVLLLHSLVEFNMRIPANAILGALLAGVYLRRLGERAPGRTHDPTQATP